eukprot:c33340_g1_i1 orf=152-364(-)
MLSLGWVGTKSELSDHPVKPHSPQNKFKELFNARKIYLQEFDYHSVEITTLFIIDTFQFSMLYTFLMVLR